MGIRTVVGVGAVPPGPSGVVDYGRLLSEELRRRGVKVDERYVLNGGLRLGDAWAAARELLRLAWAVPRDSVVLWHYSSFSYTLRGVPHPGVLLGCVLRSRRIAVVTLLHEPAYAFGRRRWKGSVQALTQQLALPIVFAGSDSVIVTTASRERAVRNLPRPFRRPAYFVPVFSTLGDARGYEPERVATRAPIVGVLSWTSDGVQPQILVQALSMLSRPDAPRLVLLGAGEPTSDEGKLWLKQANTARLRNQVEFTGVIGAEQLSSCIHSCDVIVFVNGEGPSSRKTTLAAALAHGRPIIVLDGPERWDELVSARAVEVVAHEPKALSSVIDRLLSDPRERRALAMRARAFYERNMTLADVATQLEVILAATPGRSERL